MRHEHFQAGDRIFEAGNRSDSFYTVVQGAVEVVYTDPETNAERRQRIEAGGHFGEGILAGHDRRRSTVRAAEDCVVMRVEHTAYLRVAEAFPAVSDDFHDHMTRTYGSAWVSEAAARQDEVTR